jgi:hypothetical protein
MKKLKADNNNEVSLILSANDKAKVTEIVSEEGSAVKGGEGPLKSVAFFLGLLIVFTAVLLPIIDKIFPDEPPVAVSSSVDKIANVEKPSAVVTPPKEMNVKKSPAGNLPPMSQEEFLRLRREQSAVK